ncbi:MAG: radical SAM protein [Nanoarchaeota archaeon]|nr:radical SAM protein [Nanoarchaeota archaeon]
MEKDIEVRLRREHIPNGVKNKPTDFWLIYDFDINLDRFIGDFPIVKTLDKIFQENSIQEERDNKIANYLQMSGILSEKRKVKSYWLPSVEDALSAPVKLFFNPSGKCPNKCLTCFAEELTKDTLEDHVARESFNQAVEMPIFWMNLGGCELAFYPLYFEFAEKAIKNGIHTSTAISGVGLKRKWAEQARDLGVKIKVSLDGPKEINDIQRPGTYGAAVEAIKLFKEIGYPVRINAVHTKYNNDEKVIDEMFEIAKMYGATGIDLSICRPKGGALRNNLMIPFEDYKNGKVKSVIRRFLYHPYIEKYKMKVWINKNVRTLNYLDAKPCQALNIHCNGGRYSMGINNNGLVDGCVFLPEEYIPKANINTPELFTNLNFILNIWQNDPTFRKVREYTKGELCPECKEKGIEFVRGCKALEAYYEGIDPAKLLH